MPLGETNNTAKYKIVWLSFELHLQNCKGKHMSLYMNMDDGIIFKYSILRYIGNTIQSLVTFSRVVSKLWTSTTTKYTIVWLSLELHAQN